VHAVVQVVDDPPAQALVAAADEHDAEVIVRHLEREPAARPAAGLGGAQAAAAVRRPVLCVPGGH